MRVNNNNNQTSFGMKDIKIIAPLGSRQYRRLEKLVDKVRPQLMEMGDEFTDLFVWREGSVKIGVCAVAGREHSQTYDIKIISGKATDWFLRKREKGLCDLTQKALSRIDTADKLSNTGYDIKNEVPPDETNLALTSGIDTLSNLLGFEHYRERYKELVAQGKITV